VKAARLRVFSPLAQCVAKQVSLIRGKEDLIEPLLDDPKLTERLFRDEEALVRVTPHMLFSVLLRRLRRELKKEAYVLDLDTDGKRIPVFEGPAVAEMLSDKQTLDYLAAMLSSFTRTNSGIIYRKERSAWLKRRLSDLCENSPHAVFSISSRKLV